MLSAWCACCCACCCACINCRLIVAKAGNVPLPGVLNLSITSEMVLQLALTNIANTVFSVFAMCVDADQICLCLVYVNKVTFGLLYFRLESWIVNTFASCEDLYEAVMSSG